MSEEIEFIPGLYAKEPHPNAPDFVKCKLSIKRKELGNYLRGKSEDWINVDIKISRNRKWYCALDEWKPDPSYNRAEEPRQPDPSYNRAEEPRHEATGPSPGTGTAPSYNSAEEPRQEATGPSSGTGFDDVPF